MNQIQKSIEEFLREARRPCLCEPGEQPIALTPANFQVAAHGNDLWIEAWDEKQNLSRRVTGIETRPERGRLSLRIEKFGKKAGTLALIDEASPAQHPAGVRHRRQGFLQRFERFLRRQFPACALEELSTSPDLHESLSPFFPRASLRLGTTIWAAIGSPADPLRTDGVLSFGLIWLDYLRRREPAARVAGLILYLPAQLAQATCLRLAFLDQSHAQYQPFLYTDDGEIETDPSDHGNLDTRLELASSLGTHSLARPSNALSGRTGIRRPEAWLESQVRQNVETLDPNLLPNPVYGQVPAFTAADRGVMDLLAADRDGRLAVIELKASEDLHLPLQALDYWLRVKWHLDRGEFRRNGYFPGVALQNTPPKLLLVTPALEVHPTNERVLRYFSPQVEVERVGISVEWRKKVRVVFRVASRMDSPCH